MTGGRAVVAAFSSPSGWGADWEAAEHEPQRETQPLSVMCFSPSSGGEGGH